MTSYRARIHGRFSNQMKMMKARLRKYLSGILAGLLGLAIFAVLAEIALRFAPVCESVYSMPTNSKSPLYRCQPNQSVFLSAYWDFALQNRVQVNNEGFVSDLNYNSNDHRPLLALVGDSYVEALWVPWKETLAGRLHQHYAPQQRVYAFSKSGAPLSQYLVYARYTQDHYRPEAMIIVIVGNDFDQSLPHYRHNPGFHQFVKDSRGDWQLKLTDYSVGTGLNLARQSALARYLIINVGIQNLHHQLRYSLNPQHYARDKSSIGNHQRIADSKPVVDAFLQRIPEAAGLPPGRIMFIFDAIRPDIYDDAAFAASKDTYHGVMREYFMQQATAAGFPFIDLQIEFRDHYARHGRRLEFEVDPHWNSLGHQVVGEAVLKSGFWERLP